jgi:hypothetical protein
MYWFIHLLVLSFLTFYLGQYLVQLKFGKSRNKPKSRTPVTWNRNDGWISTSNLKRLCHEFSLKTSFLFACRSANVLTCYRGWMPTYNMLTWMHTDLPSCTPCNGRHAYKHNFKGGWHTRISYTSWVRLDILWIESYVSVNIQKSSITKCIYKWLWTRVKGPDGTFERIGIC